MTHRQLLEKLANDENIYDNIDICAEHEEDPYGNSIITMSLEGLAEGRKKAINGMVIFVFNQAGRMVNMSIATCKNKKGKDDWQIATSDTFDDFKRYFTRETH